MPLPIVAHWRAGRVGVLRRRQPADRRHDCFLRFRVTKYGYKILRGDIAERARDLLRQIYMARGVTIIRGAVSPAEQLLQEVMAIRSALVSWQRSSPLIDRHDTHLRVSD